MIITIANNKGGVCKTTLAVHLATWLSRQGWHVILVDLDPQGNVAAFLGLEPADDLAELVQSVLHLSASRRPAVQLFLAPVRGYKNLLVLRGAGRSARLEVDLNQPGSPPAADVLREALSPFRHPDIQVIVDTGPFRGTLQEAALEVADHVVVPGIPEAATENGILDIARRLSLLKRGITGVVPVRFMRITREHTSTIKAWKATLGKIVYYEPQNGLVGLPQRVVWGEIVRSRQPIWDANPPEWEARQARDKAATEMIAVLERIAYDAEIAF